MLRDCGVAADIHEGVRVHGSSGTQGGTTTATGGGLGWLRQLAPSLMPAPSRAQSFLPPGRHELLLLLLAGLPTRVQAAAHSLVECHLDKASICHAQMDFRRSCAEVEALLELDPAHHEAWNMLGACRWARCTHCMLFCTTTLGIM